MRLIETVNSFLKQPKIDAEEPVVRDENVLVDLSNNDLYPNTTAFFDESQSGVFGEYKNKNVVQKQKNKIESYRAVAMNTDVINAIDEIVNEIIFNYDDKDPIQIEINEENDKLVDAVTEKFDKVMKLLNVKRNLFPLVKRGYVDGQLVIHTEYEENNTSKGIQGIKMIEPCGLYFDKKDNKFKYLDDTRGVNATEKKTQEFSLEEVVVENFGLSDGNVNLGYLEYAIKPANILKTLEDLLVPLRFSRSISRRVFNVDIGDLPGKRGAEVMKDYQQKFKYKKFYNNETGEVSNQQHVTSMVEDYWFSNRSGGKGTQVDVLDETGNLGELGDILYSVKKLYTSLKIPASRINSDPDSDHDFDYDSTRVSKDDMKFFMFISRLRQVYTSAFKELLKLEVISTGVMSEEEWEDKEDLINIRFTNENTFIEKMKTSSFQEKISAFEQTQELQGKMFSINTLIKEIFRTSDDEIEDELKKIQKEKTNKLYADFYATDEDSGF